MVGYVVLALVIGGIIYGAWKLRKDSQKKSSNASGTGRSQGSGGSGDDEGSSKADK